MSAALFTPGLAAARQHLPDPLAGIEFGPYSALDPFPELYIGRIDVDPARRLVAEDGCTGTAALVPLLRSLGGRSTFRVYAVIPPRQAVPAGDYTDHLTIEVGF